MEEKRIYSLNLIAYLIYMGLEPKLYKDNENGKFYAVVNKDIGNIILKYKNNIYLHKYLDAYARLREQIEIMRSEE